MVWQLVEGTKERRAPAGPEVRMRSGVTMGKAKPPGKEGANRRGRRLLMDGPGISGPPALEYDGLIQTGGGGADWWQPAGLLLTITLCFSRLVLPAH